MSNIFLIPELKKIKTIKNIYNKHFNNKNINECIFQIPANIFQTWESKKIPPLMFQNILLIVRNNPKFRYYLFDDNDCQKFIKDNFSEEILNTYNNLIPGAYKADLWRYCILYKMGGIYIDIKYRPINGFRLYNLLEKEHWVLDIDNKNIYNAIMVCKPGNQILLNAINKIVENVTNKYYGNSPFEPTGPALLEKFFLIEEKSNFDMKHILYGDNDYEKVVQYNSNNIFSCYPGYFKEREYSFKKHYSNLWQEKSIYL
jgi:mannosyltransferase OCH1-like enzyme